MTEQTIKVSAGTVRKVVQDKKEKTMVYDVVITQKQDTGTKIIIDERVVAENPDVAVAIVAAGLNPEQVRNPDLLGVRVRPFN